MTDPILRCPELKPATGLSRTTIYRMIARGEFPEGKQLSINSVGWPLSVINAWRESRGLTAYRLAPPQPVAGS